MSNWIDQNPPYPFSLPQARDLHKRLVNTFYEPTEIRTLIKSANAPDWTNISFATGPNQIWIDILDRAVAEGSLRTLLNYIVSESKVAKALIVFIQELLDNKAPPSDPGPGDKTGPGFASDITNEEALLFGDNLSESVGEIPALLAGIEKVMRWRGAVCHLSVTTASSGPWVGTGTLLTNNCVLTNYHVLFPQKENATSVSVSFNYEKDEIGQTLASKIVPGDIATIVGDSADDWAVISVQPPAGFTGLDLATQFAKAQVGERALILQHPNGGPKRLAFVRNRISAVADRRVYYLTDTEGGSSGSPVFNTQGQITALHRAGGTPQKLVGSDPIKKNEGVRIDCIVANVLNAKPPQPPN